MTPLFRKFLGMNWPLFANMLGLLVFGIFAIYSACWLREESELATKWRDQVYWACLGMVAFFTASLVDYRLMRYVAIPAYIGSIGLLIFTAFFGISVHGTRAWISVGPAYLQTSQVAIVASILLLALTLSTLHHLHPILRSPFIRLAASGIIVGIPFLFVLAQGDFGSALVWIPLFAVLVIIGNIPFRYLIVIGLTATMFVPFVFYFGMKDYQKRRITTQIEMLQGKQVNILGDAYSAHNNLLAIGSAGWRGKGFRNPDTVNNKGFISPDTAINDFIFPVVSEEFGFRGGVLLLGAFLLLLLQCIYVAFYSRDMMGRLIVSGVVALLFAHIFQNIGMNLLITPITGIPLPFISYGGSFLVTTLFLMGLVQSVWIHRAEEEQVHTPLPLEIEHLD